MQVSILSTTAPASKRGARANQRWGRARSIAASSRRRRRSTRRRTAHRTSWLTHHQTHRSCPQRTAQNTRCRGQCRSCRFPGHRVCMSHSMRHRCCTIQPGMASARCPCHLGWLSSPRDSSTRQRKGRQPRRHRTGSATPRGRRIPQRTARCTRCQDRCQCCRFLGHKACTPMSMRPRCCTIRHYTAAVPRCCRRKSCPRGRSCLRC